MKYTTKLQLKSCLQETCLIALEDLRREAYERMMCRCKKTQKKKKFDLLVLRNSTKKKTTVVILKCGYANFFQNFDRN